jgi:hypothetical protein
LIKRIVDLVKIIEELLAIVLLSKLVKLEDLDVDYSYLSFFVNVILLAQLDLVPDHLRHKHVQDRFQLDEVSYFSVSIHELGLFLQFLDVNIGTPDNSHENPDRSIEARCKRPPTNVLFIGGCQETEENIHHHRNQNHDHGNVDVGMI